MKIEDIALIPDILRLKVRIRDADALERISPLALEIYAKEMGWEKTGEKFGEYSDVYQPMPIFSYAPVELIIPFTDKIADYYSVCGRLIEIFSEQLGIGQLEVYYRLLVLTKDLSIDVKGAKKNNEVCSCRSKN